MVKKKPPFIPLTIVVVGIAAAFALNVKARPLDPAEQAKEMAEKNAKKDAPETPNALGKATKQSLSTTAKDGGPGGGPGGAGMMRKGPGDGFVTGGTPKMMKPTKSDTATASLWYKN